MATSMLTLPVDAISAARASFSKSPTPSTRARHPNDQEAIEMDTLGTPNKASSVASTSVAPEVPAWNMSAKKEWTAINRFGFGKVILLGGLLQVVAYCLLAPALPFPVMCIAYAINGFGIALQDAQANGFVAALPNNASAKMGLLHAAYGAGAFVAPLVATQFAQLPRWSFHYLTSLGLAIINAISLLVVFRLRSQDEILGISSTHTDTNASANEQNKYKQIFSSRAVQLMAFFVWVYVGTEVTIGGWIVTFVIEERGGGPSAGYISRQVSST
ncbi:hypothetical protein FS749_003877 [Ceratobasidium sp. UAMH 11750]|nr:hypothetical protein FS749_003877 [Ceratobasidium sp. UAMH 11750]